MKKWKYAQEFMVHGSGFIAQELIDVLLKNRGLTNKKDIEFFLHPPDPYTLTPQDVDIDKDALAHAIERIKKAIHEKESIVVYADYDADGITSGAIMWETLHALGAHVMPYIPHRVEEGYGLSVKGIDAVIEQHHPTLIITVDHGVTAWEKVAYAKSLGIDVVITDHHVLPEKLPKCLMVHTTKLCGAGISWFVAKELLQKLTGSNPVNISSRNELLALAAIGTIADMVPLLGPNRAIVKHGLEFINQTTRIGLEELIIDAGLTKGSLRVYDISHVLAPRLNAMGRLDYALDALRLLCTKNRERARELAAKLGLTNKERQQMTIDTTLHAMEQIRQGSTLSVSEAKVGKNVTGSNPVSKKLLFLADETYNQGVIGLVAGKLVEEFYLPAIVVSRGEAHSKASARSIPGFNIVEAIRSCQDILVDVGGHPMAAGFTIETKNLEALKLRLEELAEKELDKEKLTRTLKIDCELPLSSISDELWQSLQSFEPFGFGNAEPVFATLGAVVADVRLVGADGKHLKLIINQPSTMKLNAIGFGLGNLYGQIKPGQPIDIAYTIDQNTWNGKTTLQLKLRDIRVFLSD